MLMTKTPAALAALTLLAVSAALPRADASDEEAVKPTHYTIAVGICGYSPVSYFESGPEPGSPAYPVVHGGVTYFLTGPEQVDLFMADPTKYLPAYGGWCAFGMAVEDHFAVDPTSYKIVDGRLMLFLKTPDVDARALWDEQGDGAAKAKADAFWNRAHGG